MRITVDAKPEENEQYGERSGLVQEVHGVREGQPSFRRKCD